MAAFRRGRKVNHQRRKKWQRKPTKILRRQRRPYRRVRPRTGTRRVMKFRRRRQTMGPYFNRRMRDNVLLSHRAKYTKSASRTKASSRKPLRAKQLQTRKPSTHSRSRILQAKLRKKARKNLGRPVSTAMDKKGRRPGRYSDDEIFYRLSKPSMSKPAAEDKQSKKHSVRFSTPGNAKTKECEQQEEIPSDSQQNQQAGTLKKRSRYSATSAFKSY